MGFLSFGFHKVESSLSSEGFPVDLLAKFDVDFRERVHQAHGAISRQDGKAVFDESGIGGNSLGGKFRQFRAVKFWILAHLCGGSSIPGEAGAGQTRPPGLSRKSLKSMLILWPSP
jgi:hypothetical protein